MATALRARLVAAWPRLLVTLGVLLPYAHLLGMRALLVTDDRIFSDAWNGEFAVRVELARLLRAGEWPVWTPRLCAGTPLGGAGLEPLHLATFGWLPAVAALDVFLLAVLLIGAHSAYAFARALGASRLGAVVGGLAYAHSGYFVCQLRHLGIMATVAWIPLALLCLERALAARAIPSFEDDPEARPEHDPPTRTRLRYLVGFGAIFGAQALAGFPQSAYIAALAYGAWALVRGVGLLRRDGARRALLLLGASAVAIVLGALVGAVQLLPMREIGDASLRVGGVSFEWASAIAYAPRNVLTFLIPYVNGDVADGTYRLPGVFWEDYGYVGLATLLLGWLAVARGYRRPQILLLAGITFVAYLMVLGPATPLFQLAFRGLPGMRNFRFPTRFLVLVDLGLAMLGALGLSEVERLLVKRGVSAARTRLMIAGLTAIAFLDVVVMNLRQNAWVDAESWLAPPATARFLRGQPGQFRIWTPYAREMHSGAWVAARGWADTTPYYQLRDAIQPNSNVYWDLDAADCYVGLTPRWTFATWGDSNGRGILVARVIERQGQLLRTGPGLFRVLRMNNVRYVLSPWELEGAGTPLVDPSSPMRIYELRDALPRAFVVGSAYLAPDDARASEHILLERFDPTEEVVLTRAPAGLSTLAPEKPDAAPTASPGAATIRSYRATEVVIDTDTTRPGFLVTSDTYFPGWQATIDGEPTKIHRANVNGRAVSLPAGKHTVTFKYAPKSLRLGGFLSLGAAAALVVATALLARGGRVRAA